MTETQRAAMQAALAALERARAYVYETERPQIDASMDDLRAALAEQDAKPVAWLTPTRNIMFRDPTETEKYHGMRRSQPLYTAPPRREWQSLTDEEIGRAAVVLFGDYASHDFEFARAIEAALREKNGGGK